MRSFGKFKIRFFSFVLFISVLFSFLITSSCEIGLGAAVDTLVPTISIDSPAADSTIRDSFSFRGTWSDDGAIMGLTVTLNTIEGDTVGQPALTKSGIVNHAQVIGQPNTWECTVEPGSEGLKDGKYEATVTITDMAGHATSVNRQITVDNTAPVVVLQRPGTDLEAAAGEMDSYGQTLSLEGQAADDSSISHIDVKVYADSKLTQLLDTVTLTNVPPTISLDVAKFGEIDYTKIYGSSEKQGTKYFWCEIEAYDSAERYPADGSEQSEEDKNGNCEKTYYLYEEIATSVLSQYKITELYKMKSGTWKDSGERSAEGISAILSEKVKRGGSFSLNPDNSPTFRVISGGLEGLKGGEENFSNGKNSITNGGELAIEVNPGLDNIPLAAGMKVYAVECDGNGNVLEGAVKLYPAGADSATKSGTKYTINPVFNQSTGSDGTGGFVFNRTYLLGVEGADESGNAIVAKEGAYGFIFTSSGARPAVTVVTPDENEHFIAKDGRQTVSGSVTVEEGLAALEIKVYRAGDEANAVTVSDSPESASHALYQSVNENGTNSFNYVIDCGAAPFNQTESGNYVIKVRASQGAKETVVTRSISYDVKGPEVKRISCEPVIKANDNSDTGKKNGTISVTGEFSDDKSGFVSGSWKVWKAAEEGAVNASTAGSLTWQEVSGLGGSLGAEEFNFNVDTRAVEGSDSVMRGMKLEFTAEDAAGNTKRTEYYYTVDQSTDIPSASGNAKLDLTLAYNGSSGTDGLRQEVEKNADVRKNVFTTGGQLVMSVKDDDGIASVVVQTVKNAAEGSDTYTASTAAADIKTDTYTYNGETSTSVTHDLPQVSGSYRVTMTITDTAGVESTGHSEYEFFVQVTGPAPEATVSGSPEWITTNAASGLDSGDSVRGLPKTKFNVSVNVTDGSERVDGGPKFLVKRSGAAGDTWTESGSVQLETDTGDSSGKTYKEGSEGYVPQAGTTKILYRVYDLFNNYKDIAFNYKIDNTAPAVAFTSSEPTTSDTENASFTFRGEASDRESGVSKVEISFDEGASWEAVSGTTGWNYNAVFADKYTSEGAKSVKVRSVDEVGNRSAEAQQSFMYDRAAPTLTGLKFKRSGEASATEAGTGFDSGVLFDLEGIAGDSNRVARVEIYEKHESDADYPATAAKTLTPGPAATAYTWNTYSDAEKFPTRRDPSDPTKLLSGTYTYKIIVYDGSSSDLRATKKVTKEFSVGVDLGAPVVTISGPGEEGEILSGATYAFSGRVRDQGGSAATGVATVEYAITPGTQSTEPASWTTITKSTDGETEASWNTSSYTLNEGHTNGGDGTASASLDEGSYKIWVRATDKAGNRTTVAETRGFKADKSVPEVNWAGGVPESGNLNRSSLGAGGSGSLNVSGSASDTNGIESVTLTKNGSRETITLTTNAATGAKEWSKSYEYGSGSNLLADGTYTFEISAEDKAGRRSSKSRSWTIDTVAPVMTNVKGEGTAFGDDRWFSSTSVSVELEARDPAQSGVTGSQASGMSLVQYSTDGLAADNDAKVWKTLNLNNGRVDGAAAFTESGSGKKLVIRAKDNVGNVSYWPDANGRTVNIDTTAANLGRTKYEINGTELTDSTVYINGEHDLSVYGTWSDEESGVGELSLEYADGNPITAAISYAAEPASGAAVNYQAYSAFTDLEAKKSIRYWKAVINKDQLKALKNKPNGSSGLVVKGSNGAGAEKSFEAYTLTWDDTDPVINGITLKWAAGATAEAKTEVYKKAVSGGFMYYMNPEGKYLTVSGTAGDTNGLAKVEISVNSVDPAPGLASGASKESWKFAGMALSGNDGEDLTVTVSATDKAGNTKDESVTVTIDKSAPLALHLLDEAGKDLYFRVGSNDNDENEGITSGDAAFDTSATNSKDKDVGGKYTGGTFGNASTIVIRGSFIDVKDGEKENVEDENATQGSGVKSIYYKVYDREPKEEDQALIEKVKGAEQYVTLKEETKRVFFTGNQTGGEYTLKKNNVDDRRAAGSSAAEPYVTKTAKASQYLATKANGKDARKHWTEITTTYKDSVTGFTEGTNYLVLVAEDNAGNCAVDTIRKVPVTGSTTTQDIKNYRLNVDTQVPEITSGTNDTVYTNLEDPLEIELTAKDIAKETGIDPAGIRSVLIEVGSRKIKEEDTVTTYGKIEYLTAAGGTAVTAKPDDVEGTETDGKNKTAYRKVTLEPEAFAELSGNITVYATVTDNAGTGNSQRVSVATVNVDRAAPDVTINDMVNADADDTAHININGKITVSGTAADNNGLGTKATDRIRLYYKPAGTAITTDAASGKVTDVTGWSEYGYLAQSSGWSLLVDTTDTTKFTDKSEYWICASATDKAGNTGYSVPKKVYVNQDSDRPKIKFSNVTLGDAMASKSSGHVWLKNTTELVGTVSDDDGVGSMQISHTGADTDWHNVTVNGSSFRYDLKNFYSGDTADSIEDQANGAKTVYFKVTDTAKEGTTAAPKTFTSKATAEGDAVFLVDGANKYGGSEHEDSRLYVKVDTKYPQVILGGAKFTGATGDFGTNYSAIKLGGTNTSFAVKFTASDTNGIDDTTVCGTAEFPYGSGNDKVTVNGASLTTLSVTDNVYTFTLTFTLTEEQKNILKAAHTEEGNTVEGYDGAVNVKISAKDNAGNETAQTATLSYDFKKASITFGNPDSSVTSSGAVDAYGNLSETCSEVYYTVAPRAMTADEKAGGAIGTAGNWTDEDGTPHPFASAKAIESWQAISDATGLSWTVKFDNATGTNRTHGKSMNRYIIDYGIASQDSSNMDAKDAIVPSFDTIVKLYMWVKSVDHAGNVSYEDHLIQVDPQGDRPTLQITTPSANNGTMGGKVSIFGTATDTKASSSDTSKIGVDSVWVQIKSTTHGSDTTTSYGTAPSYDASTGSIGMSLTKKDLEYMASMKDGEGNNYHVYKMSDYNAAAGTGTEWKSCSSDADAKDYAILASLSGAAWELEINARGELDPPQSTDTSTTSVNPVAIRVMARDKDNKFSTKADRYVRFDADTPQIKDLKLVQSDSDDITAAATAEKPYSSENFVKGVWYVTGTAEDKDAINTLVIGTDTLVQDGSVTEAWRGKVKLWKPDSADPETLVEADTLGTKVEFKYALDTGNGYGTAVKVISATDKASGSPHTGNATVSVKYDNEAPVLATTAAQGFNIASSVQQNNSWYTFGSKAFENSTSNDENVSQSGFAYTAFYFVRNNTIDSTKTLYDVLRARKAAAIDITGTAIAALGSETSEADNTIVTDSGLYWYRKGISSVSGNTITLNGASGIRGSSLIKIKGVIYLVESVSGDSVTLTTQPPADADVAYAAIAGVVNNTVVEGEGNAISTTDGYYDAPSRDDGDRMMESVYRSGTAWEWEAKICSRNIPDGPVTLHYVVFDKAGNYTASSVDATVSNNRPRIAGVVVKTDYNGDGDVDDEGETINNYSRTQSYSQYWTAGTEGDSSTYVFDPDKRVVNAAAKNPLPVYLECGSASEPVASLRGKTVIQPEIVGGNGSIYYSYKVTNGKNINSGNNSHAFMTGSLDYTAVTGDINVHAGDLLSFGDTADATKGIPFEFKFWDSTEGSEAFSPTAPSQTAELKMYFAVQAQTVGTPVVKVTPFYWEGITSNSVEKSANPSKYTQLEGHIELEEDLTFTGSTFISDSGLMDKDAKVSGKIILEGTAHDNNLINTISADIFGTTKTLAHYDLDSGRLVSNKTAYDAEGWYFEVVREKTGKNGHDVTWKLHIDTEVLGQAAIDTEVTVTATNMGKPTYGEGSNIGISGTGGYAKIPSYENARSNDPSAYASTARGKTTWATAKTSWAENSVFTDTAFKKAVQKKVKDDGTAVYYILDANGNEVAMADTDVVYVNTARTARYRMDIVPYIREVKTSLSTIESGNPTVYSRTALGHYPVYTTFEGGASATATATNYNSRLREKISLEGFNLSGCTLNFKNDDTNSLKVTGGLVQSSATAALEEGEYTIPTGAGSGHVYVSRTIGEGDNAFTVESLNNLNNDDAKGASAKTPSDVSIGDTDSYADYYNRQPNGTNNNRLTDDVYIDIWEFNRTAAKSINNSALDIMMEVNPANGVIGFAFRDGDLFWSMANGDASVNKFAYTKDYLRCTGFAYDKNGNSYGTALGGESGDNYADNYCFFINTWGNNNGKGTDTRQVNDLTRSIRIGSSICNDYTNLSKFRYVSPSIASDGNGNVYIAYFDILSGDIRFMGGKQDGTNHKYGTLWDIYSKAPQDAGNNKQRTKLTLEQERSYVQVVATSDGSVKSGKYLDIGVTSNTTNPIVVMVWYDGDNLLYSYNQPTDAGRTGVNRTGWSTPKTLLSGAGQYCQLVVDNDDNIHVVAFDNSTEEIKYIFIDDYAKPEDKVVCTVDSYGSAGYMTIDVAKKDGKQIPFIGYYDGTAEKPRYAYLTVPPATLTSTTLAGSKSGGKYTGVWECTVVPTTKVEGNSPTDDIVITRDKFRRINVSVWKNSGELAYSTTGINKGAANGVNSYLSSYTAPNQSGTGDAKLTNSTNTCYCYGNGSKNGVLAYGVIYSSEHDYVETAQKR